MKNIYNIIERDIIFFDLESTGVDLKTDRIIELSAVKYTKNQSKISLHKRFDPKIPISKGASDIHGITNEMLEGCNTFTDSVEELYNFFIGCDLGGYNCLLFDIPLLYEEFARAGKNINFFNINIIDSYNLLNKYETRKLSDVYKRFFGEELEDAHSAEADIEATIKVFEKQVEVYGLEDKSIKEISDIIRSTSNNERILDFSGWFRLLDGEYYFGKGKWKGHLVKENLDYLNWLITNESIENNSRTVGHIIQKKLRTEISA
jgi:DNA polymerase III subunit epsilon